MSGLNESQRFRHSGRRTRPPPDLSSIDPRLDLEAEIRKLKRQKNAVLLAHYYQEEAIQDLADFVGDSLDLSRKAQAERRARSSRSPASGSWPRRPRS